MAERKDDKAAQQAAAAAEGEQPDASSAATAPAAPFYSRVGDFIRDPAAWQDFEKVDFDQLDGSEIVVHDVMFLKGDFQKADPDYAIILFARVEDGIAPERVAGREVPVNARTTASGGSVLVRKLKQLSAYGPGNEGRTNVLPVIGTFVLRKGDNYPQPYADFI